MIVADRYARILSPLAETDREVFLRGLIALVDGPLAQPLTHRAAGQAVADARFLKRRCSATDG